MRDNNKNFHILPEYVWMIFVGMLLAIIILMHIVPGRAAEINSSVFTEGFLLEESSDPYSYLGPAFGYSSNLLGAKNDILFQRFLGSDTNDGSMLVNYRLGEYGNTEWNGSMQSSGLDFHNYRIIKGNVSSLGLSSRFYVSKRNWVSTSPIPFLYRDRDSIYFRDVNGVVYCLWRSVSWPSYYDLYIKSDRTIDTVTFDDTYHLAVATDLGEAWSWVTDGLDISALSSIYVASIINAEDFPGAIDTRATEVAVECTKLGVVVPEVTLTPSPSPAPIESELVVLKKGFRYYFIRLDVSDLGVVLTTPNDSILQYVQSRYGSSSDQLLYNAFVYCWGSGDPAASFSFSASDCQLSMAVSQSFNESLGKDYYFENLSFTQYSFLSSETGGSNTSHQQYGLLVGFRQNSGLSSFLVNFSGYSSNGSEISLVYSSFSMVSERVDSINYIYGFSSSTLSSAPYLITLPIRLGLSSGNTVGPSPSPTPTPSPIPTEAPHVIINWPTSTPTPTPYLDINIPSSPGGDLNGDTTDGVLSDGLDFIRNGRTSGLLSTAFSFIPDELQFLIWFLIFLLIILAALKLILHFGG